MSEGRAAGSLPDGYFQELYRADPDPWRFATSAYEAAKYEATLAALPRPTYARALEVGCSVGVLTRQLAVRCRDLLALDVADEALARARHRCADLPQVRFERRRVPADWPAAEPPFDLILLSEVVYYLDRADVERLAQRTAASAASGGGIVLVHWTGETDYPLSGDEASDLFIRASRSFATLLRQERTDSYRLDVLRAATGPR